MKQPPESGVGHDLHFLDEVSDPAVGGSVAERENTARTSPNFTSHYARVNFLLKKKQPLAPTG